MPTCTIEFDKSSKETYGSKGVFYSGQTVNGTVIFMNEKSRKMYSISLIFEGYAKCRWTKKQGKTSVTYRGREDFINEVKYLIASEVKGKEMELAEGLHKFAFSFKIPEQVPTSIEALNNEFNWTGDTYGYKGCIRYLLTVKADRSWKSDIKYEFPLTIIKNFDLNYSDSRFRVPLTAEDTKNFTFSSKTLKMSVDAQCTAFVGGQMAKFLVSYNNESSTEVLQTKVQLVRVNYYTSDKPKTRTKIRNENIKESIFEGVEGKTAKNVETCLEIPSVAPSSDGSCRVLLISYEMHLTAVFGSMHSDHTIKIPIVIGTIPFLSPKLLSPLPEVENNYFGFPVASAPPSLNTLEMPSTSTGFSRDSYGWNFGASTSTAYSPLPPVASAPVPTTPDDYDMPPPSYVEATAGRPLSLLNEPSNDEARRNSYNFNPSYPVYNFEQSQEGNLPPKYYR